MGPLEAGLWTAPSGLLFAAGSLVAPQLVRRWAVSTVIAASLVVAAAGFLLLAQQQPPFWLFMAGFLTLCAGLAPLGTLSTDLVLGTAPPERAGAASAISETSFELGGALGIAVMGSLVNALYLAAVGPGMPDTLAGALAAANRLEADTGAALLAAARQAYAGAMATAALVGALLTPVAAAAAAVLLRARQPY
jgi:DHA2 family multidrug resistance protein-like MFS transporter